MATITGLTAARMQAIEAASIVDGDIVGDDLILTKFSGATVNAGNVRGPAGPAGATGSDLAVVSSQQVLDVGISGQIRAGRQLTAADFTAMGLQAPAGLWNLSNVNDSSGNGRNLVNKGTVTFGKGIGGAVTTAAQFAGAVAQAFYILDVGAADPFRIRSGSIGAWVRAPRRGYQSAIMGKYASADGQHAYWLQVKTDFKLEFNATHTGLIANVQTLQSVITIDDDNWHFVVCTHDGASMRMYIDGVLDALTHALGPIFGGNAPFNIGGLQANAGTNATSPWSGRIDEAFVTPDVLSEDQVRNLYCAKIAHSLGAIPKRAGVLVRRRKKGAALVSADFPSQPLRLYNFSAAALTDLGVNNQALTANNGPISVAGVDGAAGNAYSLIAASSMTLTSTDTGLPSALATRSFGGWFKVPLVQGDPGLMTWGATPGGTTVAHGLYISSAGKIVARSFTDDLIGPFIAHGNWVFVVAVEDNTVADGAKRKLYVDGKLVSNSTAMSSITLGGASRFRIGQWPDGTWAVFAGVTLDSLFVCNYALDASDIAALYAKGSQALGVSLKDAGDHIEAMTSTDLLCVFDEIESQNQIDLVVA